MKNKELITRLQSLDPDMDVYLCNNEETYLSHIDVVKECEDFLEDDREEFIVIFPKLTPNLPI